MTFLLSITYCTAHLDLVYSTEVLGVFCVDFSWNKTAKHRVHYIFFSLDPGNLLNLIGPDPMSSDRPSVKCRFGRLRSGFDF